MILPEPKEMLGGCVWLPRILCKARLLSEGKLPDDYEDRFCHPTGVDGQFLRFFGLDRETVLEMARMPDCDALDHFQRERGVGPEKIAEWNEIAVNLGREGYPMSERFRVALSTTYRYLNDGRVETIFEMLKADDLASR